MAQRRSPSATDLPQQPIPRRCRLPQRREGARRFRCGGNFYDRSLDFTSPFNGSRRGIEAIGSCSELGEAHPFVEAIPRRSTGMYQVRARPNQVPVCLRVTSVNVDQYQGPSAPALVASIGQTSAGCDRVVAKRFNVGQYKRELELPKAVKASLEIACQG